MRVGWPRKGTKALPFRGVIRATHCNEAIARERYTCAQLTRDGYIADRHLRNINTKNAPRRNRRLAGGDRCMCTRKDRQYEDRDCWWRVKAAGTRQPLEIIGPRIRDGKEGGARCDVRSTITSIVSVKCRSERDAHMKRHSKRTHRYHPCPKSPAYLRR